jgi:hypothetical protein
MIDAIVVAMLVYRLLPTVQEPFPASADGASYQSANVDPKAISSHPVRCTSPKLRREATCPYRPMN